MENVKSGGQKLELCQEGKADIFLVQPENPQVKMDWITKFKQLRELFRNTKQEHYIGIVHIAEGNKVCNGKL